MLLIQPVRNVHVSIYIYVCVKVWLQWPPSLIRNLSGWIPAGHLRGAFLRRQASALNWLRPGASCLARALPHLSGITTLEVPDSENSRVHRCLLGP